MTITTRPRLRWLQRTGCAIRRHDLSRVMWCTGDPIGYFCGDCRRYVG